MTDNVSKILLATDGSEGSLRAARFAGSIARPLGAQVTILTAHDNDLLVLNSMGPSVWPGAVPDTLLNFEEVKAATEKQTESTTIAQARKALGDLTRIDTVQMWGHTAEAICNYATENGFDLIVIGSRGRSAFSRLLLGSISSQVSQHSSCPVTIVH
ncbi:MAG: nucleotide-binding universal stress UspA family protein [Gammaproteobacteria bacterium]|jgi:nucleotide-binding universal stress UspA family protein